MEEAEENAEEEEEGEGEEGLRKVRSSAEEELKQLSRSSAWIAAGRGAELSCILIPGKGTTSGSAASADFLPKTALVSFFMPLLFFFADLSGPGRGGD